MQIGFTVGHHDHDYLERRGGIVFLSHLRGGRVRSEYRRAAVDRAATLHAAQFEADASEESICGAGLIVLQRAAFAAEDVAGLCHALRNDDAEAAADPGYERGNEIWPSLLNLTAADVRATFTRIVLEPSRALSVFRLPPDAVLRDESMSEATVTAARRLRELTGDRWLRMLVGVATFWLAYGDAAKATMHGFGAIAGRHFRQPPGAGELGEGVTVGPGPSVVLVNSTVRGQKVDTPRTVLSLDPARVRRFRAAGVRAAKLNEEMCSALAHGIESGHAYGIPDIQGHLLSDSDRSVLREHIAAQPER